MLLSRRSDPGRARGIQDLGIAKLIRYLLSGQQDDLEQSILCFTEAIFLPLSWHTCPLNIVETFNSIAFAILHRARDSRQPEDFTSCITYLRYLHGRCREVAIDFPSPVPASLVIALAVRGDLVPGYVYQGIEEMADLCDELLNSDSSIELLTIPLTLFARAASAHPKGAFSKRIQSERVINCLRRVSIRLPDFHEISSAFSQCLLRRFTATPLGDDYEEGMAILNKIITFRGPGDSPSPYRRKALERAAIFADIQLQVCGKPEQLERAIYHNRVLLDEIPLDDPNRPMYIRHLSRLQRWRFNGPSVTENDHSTPSSTSASMQLPSFRDLILDLNPVNSVNSRSMATFYKHFDALKWDTIKCLTDVADIKDGVEYCRQLLASHPGSMLAPLARSALCDLFSRAFECTNEIKYLDEAVSAARGCIDATDPSTTSHFPSLLDLISLLSIRLYLLQRGEDLDELMQVFPIAAKHDISKLVGRFEVSCEWAATARRYGHPSILAAYDCAMSSMQACLTFAPTLDGQHSRLVTICVNLVTVPLEYTSYQIVRGRLEQAIETLERGRALLWSEMRGLRASIDQIRLADSHLADKFDAVNRDLEMLALAFSPAPNNPVDNGNSDTKGMDPYSHLVMRKQKLLDDRKKLISQIQALPGFDTFLKPPSFDTLRSAALHGPVIIINHCKWQSAIIILLHNSPPTRVFTSHDFFKRAKKLQDQLLGERKKGLESVQYEDTLRSVLKELYDLVGRPVIEKLNELNVPEQSRVWWCPTSVCCSLPLHAMGPIPSDVGRPRYFLDLYIPSYIPSLSALIESRKPGSQSFKKPSMLLVLQPDASMVEALGEMQVVQAVKTRVTTLIGATATPSAVLGRLQDHQFAHIVCHGILEPGKPFDSSFKLYNGKRLSLLDVVRSRLPNAEFAFLAACHTAELTDESPADEALHLAAAMQYCGFRSVVGTMWAMADTDGQDLAGNFYKSVFSSPGRGQGVHYHEITAEALRDAVVKLRKKRGRGMTLERWVNYVHYGA